MENRELVRLAEWIAQSDNIVFFGGAGVSTESGIPDFRSADGIYNTQRVYGRSPEELLSHSFFVAHPEEFYEYYKKNLVFREAQPNACHKALAEWEAAGKVRAVVTQNIDGLHQKAGSRKVLELHGSIRRNYCMKCGRPFGEDAVLNAPGVPRCPDCGGIIRPDVVLYEEALDGDVLEAALTAIAAADILIVGGTSLVVYPAAGLVRYYGGKKLVLMNRDKTSFDSRANLIIREPIAQSFGEIMGLVKNIEKN